MTIREMVREIQIEVRDTDPTPMRAAQLLNDLTSLLGNVNDEIRQADVEYAHVLLQCLSEEKAANKAKILAQTKPEFARQREARDTKELVVEMARSLKYTIRAASEEMGLTR